jgi:hypothetical protein
MRGGRALRHTYALLFSVSLIIMLSTCDLELKPVEPSLEIQAETAYKPSDQVTLRYKFFADEPVLRCRYALSEDGQELLSGQTGQLAANVWHDQLINVSDFRDGKYRFRLVVQAERSGEFVDLAFLDKSVDFYLDSENPFLSESAIVPSNSQRFAEQLQIHFDNSVWAPTEGSPVKVFFTTDGSDPSLSTNTSRDVRYDETPITLPFDRGDVPFRAVAEDAAGNISQCLESTYRFIKVVSANPSQSPKTACDIILTGFGFVNVSKLKNEDVNMYDSRGTKVYTMYDANITATTIQFRVDMNNTSFGSIVADDSIPGRIDVTCHDPNATTASIPFKITTQ